MKRNKKDLLFGFLFQETHIVDICVRGDSNKYPQQQMFRGV